MRSTTPYSFPDSLSLTLVLHQFQHGLAHRVADASEPDGAAQVMVSVVPAGFVPLLLILLPRGVQPFRRLVNQQVRAEGLYVALELRHVVHRHLRLADREHRPAGRLRAVLAHGGDHKRQVRRPQVLAHVVDEVLHVGGVFLLGAAVLIVPALEPDKTSQLELLALQRREHRLVVVQRLLDLGEHVAVRRAIALLDVVHVRQRIVPILLLVVLLDAILRLFKFLLELGLRIAGRGRAEELDQGMPAPGRLDQQHRLLELVAHHRAKFQFDAGAAGRSVADRQRTLAIEVLDEHVVADDPLAVLAQVLEQVLGLGVLGLVIQQTVRGLAFHVRLAGEDEDLDSLAVIGGCSGYKRCCHSNRQSNGCCTFSHDGCSLRKSCCEKRNTSPPWRQDPQAKLLRVPKAVELSVEIFRTGSHCWRNQEHQAGKASDHRSHYRSRKGRDVHRMDSLRNG